MRMSIRRLRDLLGVLPNSPPQRGGVDATSKRCREATFEGADGVVRHEEHFGLPDHPVCNAKKAMQHFIDAAATPPVSGGEFRASGSVGQESRKTEGNEPVMPVKERNMGLH